MKQRGWNSDTPSVLYGSNRAVTPQEVEQIRALILRHPNWGRQALSVHLCQLWDWRRPDGTLNHRACRHLLKRLFSLLEKHPLVPTALYLSSRRSAGSHPR